MENGIWYIEKKPVVTTTDITFCTNYYEPILDTMRPCKIYNINYVHTIISNISVGSMVHCMELRQDDGENEF